MVLRLLKDVVLAVHLFLLVACVWLVCSCGVDESSFLVLHSLRWGCKNEVVLVLRCRRSIKEGFIAVKHDSWLA